MKLNSLYIEEFKILKKFNINFKKDISIFIGINGSGKSTILEAIAWIFRCAHLTFVESRKENTTFAFKISYTLSLKSDWIERSNEDLLLKEIENVNVTISTESTENISDFSLILETDHENLTRNQLIDIYGIDKLLPQNILVYYSGWFETMEWLCREHEVIYKDRLRETAKSTERGFSVLNPLPMLYIQKIHFEILLASLFSFEYNTDLDKFFDGLQIIKEKSSTVSLIIKKREWAKGENEESFWGAKGILAQFLFLCRDRSLSKVSFDSESNQYIFVFTIDNWYKLREEYVEEKKLFYILHMLHSSEMLVGVQVLLTKEEHNISHEGLSEGEQQLITIRGINELLIETNTLLLLDEPDTYLHPSWQRMFIEFIIQLIEKNDNVKSQYVICTHSPQLLSNANPEKTEVQILENGETVKITPKYYGKDISTILFEMMGVERRNRTVTQEISKLFVLIEDEKIEEAKEQLKKLSDLLGEDDPAITNAETQLNYLEDSLQ